MPINAEFLGAPRLGGFPGFGRARPTRHPAPMGTRNLGRPIQPIEATPGIGTKVRNISRSLIGPEARVRLPDRQRRVARGLPAELWTPRFHDAGDDMPFVPEDVGANRIADLERIGRSTLRPVVVERLDFPASGTPAIWQLVEAEGRALHVLWSDAEYVRVSLGPDRPMTGFQAIPLQEGACIQLDRGAFRGFWVFTPAALIGAGGLADREHVLFAIASDATLCLENARTFRPRTTPPVASGLDVGPAAPTTLVLAHPRRVALHLGALATNTESMFVGDITNVSAAIGTEAGDEIEPSELIVIQENAGAAWFGERATVTERATVLEEFREPPLIST